MPDVMLVEDDETIGRSLVDAMRGARYEVQWCRGGVAAINAAQPGSACDLVVLDLGLPDLDGMDVCRALRARMPGAVIVILTARDAEIDVVVGLEAGADDYLTKPVRTVEFLARLRAHLRRAKSAPLSNGGDRMVGALRVDEAARRVWLGPTEIELRAKHFDLLARLATEPGVALSREVLMADVWDENWFGSTKTLDVHVAGLRRCLAKTAAESGLQAPDIVTLRGFGYRLEATNGEQQVAGGNTQRGGSHQREAGDH